MSAKITTIFIQESRFRNRVSKVACLFAVLCVLLFSCNTFKRYYPFKTSEESVPKGSRILVEPVIVSSSYPRSYDKGLVVIQELIRSKLKDAGYVVLTNTETNTALKGLSTFGKITINSRTGGFDIGQMQDHRRKYLMELSKRNACDIVLSAIVTIRRANFMGEIASWDGVVRTVPRDHGSMETEMIELGGHGQGLSLGVRVTDLDKRPWFQKD